MSDLLKGKNCVHCSKRFQVTECVGKRSFFRRAYIHRKIKEEIEKNSTASPHI